MKIFRRKQPGQGKDAPETLLSSSAPRRSDINNSWKARITLILSTLFFFFVVIEVGLRLFDPSILRFLHQSRQYHSYSPLWGQDMIPNSVAHMQLSSYNDLFLYNFLVTINQFGFRTHDRELDSPLLPISAASKVVGAPSRFVHAIGDSFTMGWGVNFQDSYPAILDWLAPTEFQVLNLGLDAYGTIAATEKSISLWDRFPADVAIQLFYHNDFKDDVDLIQLRQQPRWRHRIRTLGAFLERYTYVANLYPAIFWYKSFDELRKNATVRPDKVLVRKSVGELIPRTDLDLDTISIDDPDHPTYRQIGEYHRFLKSKEARLVVLIIDMGIEAQAYYKYCRQAGIEAYLLSFQSPMLLVADGHFNRAGNWTLAKFAQRVIFPEEP